jgi:hypothetical protein
MYRWIIKSFVFWPWFFALYTAIFIALGEYWTAAGGLCMGFNSICVLYDFPWRDDEQRAKRIMVGIWLLGSLLMATPTLKQSLS